MALADHGACVAMVARSAPSQSEEVAGRIRAMGRKAWVFAYDLAETSGLADLAERAWTTCGRIDLLVNNAGIGMLNHFSDISLAEWRAVMAVNLDAVFILSREICVRMIRDGVRGRVLIVSSVNGQVASAGLAHYNASKGALVMLTKSLAVELGPYGINVNSIAPGNVNTSMAADFPDLEPLTRRYLEHVPLGGRIAEIEDCVGPAIFLLSQASAFITGQHLVIDGGLTSQQLPRLDLMPPPKHPAFEGKANRT